MVHILAMVDIASLQSVVRCLMVEYNLRVCQPSQIDILAFPPDALLCLYRLQTLMRTTFPSTYEICVRYHLATVHASSACMDATSALVPQSVAALLEKTRRLTTNPYFPLMYFLDTEMCGRCRGTLSTEHYWSQTRPVHLCPVCHRRMERTTSLEAWDMTPYEDGYAWVPPLLMKSLCGVDSSTKASTYATERGIRAKSRALYDFVDALERFPVRKDYYFWADVKRFVR
jgi:hypothetical protein